MKKIPIIILVIFIALLTLLVGNSVKPDKRLSNYKQTPNTTEKDFEYVVKDREAEITKYVGSNGKIVMPEKINGYPITAIGVELSRNAIF